MFAFSNEHQQSVICDVCVLLHKVKDHARKLLEKVTGQPFFKSAVPDAPRRMDRAELNEGLRWISQYFYLIRCEVCRGPNRISVSTAQVALGSECW